MTAADLVLSPPTDFEAGPRRSTRIRSKPPCLILNGNEPEDVKSGPAKQQKKKRKKLDSNLDIEDEDDDDDQVEIIATESTDIAPLFLRRQWQEQVRAQKKAKQEFLHSGVPDALRQQTAIQMALEQREVDIFPRISHVTQMDCLTANVMCCHKLPYPVFLTNLFKPVSHKRIATPATFASSLTRCSLRDQPRVIHVPPETNVLEWRQCKGLIQRLKEQHQLNFPFFKIMRSLLSKERNTDELLWTDVCGTTQWIDHLSNRKITHRLRSWLKEWQIKAGLKIDPCALQKKAPAAAVNSKINKRKRIDSEASENSDVVVEDIIHREWKDDSNDSTNDRVMPFTCQYVDFANFII